MKKLTVLKIGSVIHLILSMAWTIIYFNELHDGRGWGLLISVGLIIIGLLGLLVSWIVGVFCKKNFGMHAKRNQNIIESVLLIAFLTFIALRYSF